MALMALRSQIRNVFSEENLKRCQSVLKNAFTPLKPIPSGEIVKKRAAVLIPLCHYHNRPSVLFIRRPLWMRKHGGNVAFPGGGVEASDSSLAAAALRESKEELGITLSPTSIVGSLSMVLATKDGSYLVNGVVSYIGSVHHPDDQAVPLGETVNPWHTLRPNRAEVDDIYVIPIKKLAASEKIIKVRLPCHGDGVCIWTKPCYPVKSDQSPQFSITIWGVTAFMLYETLGVLLPSLSR